MTPVRGGRLQDHDRRTLAAMMDRLIPPVGDLPAAGQMGLAAKVEERARRAPSLRSALASILDAVSLDMAVHASGGFNAITEERRDEVLKLIESTMPQRFTTFLQLVYTVYYMEPAVQARIGWSGRPPQPGGFELPPFDETLLDPVKRRERFWKQA